MSYTHHMFEIVEDRRFAKWLASLRDSQAKAKIAGRIQRSRMAWQAMSNRSARESASCAST